jgi:hypothetical protein
MFKRLAVCGVTALITLTASTLFAQGLGDAARKEQERRKKAAEAGVQARTIGDEELKAGPTGGRGTFSGGGEAAPSNAPAQDDTGSRKPVSEASKAPRESTDGSDPVQVRKQQRAAELRTKLRELEARIRAGTASLKAAEDDWRLAKSQSFGSALESEARARIASEQKEGARSSEGAAGRDRRPGKTGEYPPRMAAVGIGASYAHGRAR